MHKFKQICVGQYESRRGLTFVVIGLTEDGQVLNHRFGQGWVSLDEPAGSNSKSKEYKSKKYERRHDEAPF